MEDEWNILEEFISNNLFLDAVLNATVCENRAIISGDSKPSAPKNIFFKGDSFKKTVPKNTCISRVGFVNRQLLKIDFKRRSI